MCCALASVRTAHRTVVALPLAASLLLVTLPPPEPAVAQSKEEARLHIAVQQVKIHDDREGALSGQGEIDLWVEIWECPEWAPLPCSDHRYSGPSIAHASRRFSGATGDTVTLDQVVPREFEGFAVYPGYHYVVQFGMIESDDVWSLGEEMGQVYHVLGTGERGLGLGTHTARSSYNFSGAGRAGDFTITYEIRRAPLPDLRPVGIKVHDLPAGTEKLVCMAFQNAEAGDAGPFEVALYVDHVGPSRRSVTAGRLPPGTSAELCVETALPNSGQHVLAVVVDEPRALTEFNETNNVYEQPYTGPNAATSPTASPTSSPSLPDLTIGAIRVNGRAPDGKDDCKEGKNDVTVVVKNAGAADAGAFVVRLQVDGESGSGIEKSVPGLEAGQEREVRFEDVRLKKGERKLAATADAGKAVTEADEANNALTVSAGCKDDD